MVLQLLLNSSQDITQIEDKELAHRIVQTNDTQLFAVLYDRYSNVVYNKCYGFATSKEEAQDLTHDIFIKMFVKLRTFKGTAKFSTWLYSFTYNFCVNYVTRNNNKKIKKNFDVQIADKEVPEVIEEDLFALKTDKLKKAMDKINPNEKMLLLLKYQDDFTVKEIQEALGIGSSAVKMRLKRARQSVINAYNNIK